MFISITASVPVRRKSEQGVNVESEQRSFSRDCAEGDRSCEAKIVGEAIEFLQEIGTDADIAGQYVPHAPATES